MKRAALGAALVTTAFVLMARTSAAQPRAMAGVATASDTEAVSLLYEDNPPADCPTQAEFEAEVSKLTSKAQFGRQPRARRVRIELSGRGTDVVGRLISGDGKNQSSRDVRGKDCREVASALAIAVALTLDPEALGLGVEATTPPESEPPAAPKPAPKPARKPTAVRPPPPAAAPTKQPSKVKVGMGAGFTLENAWAPQMRPGGRLLGVVAVGERVRVSLGVTRFITREVDNVSFGAWFADGSLSVNLAVLGVLRPFAGVGFEAGAVAASGSGLSTTVEATRPWQAGSAALGLRFETEGFFFQLGGSLLVPVSRQRYLVSDPFGKIRILYGVPSFGLKQETSLGVFL